MTTTFFRQQETLFLIQSESELSAADIEKLEWLLDGQRLPTDKVEGAFIGPRREMISPYSTNATEIATNVGIVGIKRIEPFRSAGGSTGLTTSEFDPMLEMQYSGLDAHSLMITAEPEPVFFVPDIAKFNTEMGLALSAEEISYLEREKENLGRDLTDSELFGFAQINSEHCRHKIFNGTFVIDGKEQGPSLFSMIKETSKRAAKNLVSAYKDNVAFIHGPRVLQFAPPVGDRPDFFELRPIDTVISLKAETHNFPTTVEPFYGASTGSGGEIRDRMAGGIGSIPLSGAAVYMTAYPRTEGSESGAWEKKTKPRKWKYQSPEAILVKASNGASDFGNKFGQPLITGSVLTYEGKVGDAFYGYDRTVMLAGGVGYANARHALKGTPAVGDKLIMLGGDNYRIGMAGGSVSSVDTGAYSQALELSAVQRANPEMQKRAFNVIRSLSESEHNPIKSVHDHGAGGHINCFAELLDPEGGEVDLNALPVGDSTLSVREIICNESQERMGLIVGADDVPLLEAIAERERAPLYVVGEVSGKRRLVFREKGGRKPVDMPLDLLFGSAPKTVLQDQVISRKLAPVKAEFKSGAELVAALKLVLSLEGVACKDWLTNKVDRSVTGRVAMQQCAGPLHLPLNDVGVMALDFTGESGIATALGSAPIPGLIDECAGSRLSVAEALTNIVWAPLKDGLSSVVLSANWMWPAKQPGEDARLYHAVQALSEFCIELGIAVPTGKDSLSMTMKYEGGETVMAPGTVIVTAAGECQNVKQVVSADLKPVLGTKLLYIDLSGIADHPLGGSSYAQTLGEIGDKAPTVKDAAHFAAGFNALQEKILAGEILAGHDISSGGALVAVAEMAFGGNIGVRLDIHDDVREVAAFLFCEKPGVVVQVRAKDAERIAKSFVGLGLSSFVIGEVRGKALELVGAGLDFSAEISELREVWFKPSYLLDRKQVGPQKAEERFKNHALHPLAYEFPAGFSGKFKDLGVNIRRTEKSGVTAAIIREKGTNGDREMAFALFAAGFDVKDVTMSDLMSGRENLKGVKLIAFPGGFSNSDVLSAGKGWAGALRYNKRAIEAVREFYGRADTMSLGVCNGCQLVAAAELLYPEHKRKIRMHHNASGKFESTFVNVQTRETNSIFLKGFAGTQLGVWSAHGEGRFELPEGEAAYDIPLKFITSDYPANPNGAEFNAAAVSSRDGRHLMIMPHIERSLYPWNWAYYPHELRAEHEISPWIVPFRNAFLWLEGC